VTTVLKIMLDSKVSAELACRPPRLSGAGGQAARWRHQRAWRSWADDSARSRVSSRLWLAEYKAIPARMQTRATIFISNAMAERTAQRPDESVDSPTPLSVLEIARRLTSVMAVYSMLEQGSFRVRLGRRWTSHETHT
jgi:hypothetical protein